MAKEPEPKKGTPPPTEKKKEQASKRPVVPPLIDMTINFSSKVFLMVSLLVALISFGTGCDLTTIFVRTMVAMIVSGLLMWVISWWVTQQYIEDHRQLYKTANHENGEGVMKDIKA